MVSRLASRLRIGEKIGLGFGLVILIFIGVIAHDKTTLARLSADYERFHAVYGARQSYAFGIERRLGAIRAAQADVLMTRRLDAVAEVTRLDEPSVQAAAEIRSLLVDYLTRFEAIVEAQRIKGFDEESGLQGAFRRTAHELEGLAASSEQIAGLETAVLRLRRREKDYLLRGDDAQLAMVDEIPARTAALAAQAPLADPDREALQARLRAYGRDFHALIEQDRRIGGLTGAMEQAAEQITPLVAANRVEADLLMSEMTAAIVQRASARAGVNLMIAFGATLLGVVFAVTITSRIVRQVCKVAGLLDRLTTETPRERIPTVPGARDEIEAMAASLNTLANH